jgi:hypothetical protein
LKVWRVESNLFVLPKEGATADECEDAAASDDSALCYAVADGATEAFDAGRWARLLAEEWVRSKQPPTLSAEFRAWAVSQGERLRLEWGVTPLPWYAEEKRRSGSFAAFVGVKFDERVEGSMNVSFADSANANSADASGASLRWRAAALGDSCFVQTRGGAVVEAFPLDRSADFNSSPILLPSAETVRESALARAVFREGEAAPGDTFFLLSDALAAWFFESCELRGKSLAEFDSLIASSENERLSEFIRGERRAGRLKDDDVAVVRIKAARV